MAIETELKLRISPENLKKLRRHSLFKAQQISAPVTQRLYNVYFDTPELELNRRRMALRLRRKGGLWIQTLKGGGQVKGGLHERLEWEVPVKEARLDFTGLDREVWDVHLPESIRARLQAVFITDFIRTSRLLGWQGAVIEVCMDNGEVKNDLHSTPICEVELELKSGEPGQLFSLAQAILDIVPVELETVSKAELGYSLGQSASPVKGVLPVLQASNSLPDALQSIIWSCLLHFQKNLQGALQGIDAEYLHQLRVALRRLRVVLGLTAKYRADDELAALRDLLSELCATLGEVREWDVLIQTVESLPLGLQSLLPLCLKQRGDRYTRLRNRADEIQRLMLRIAIWMNGNYWQQDEAPSLHDFATRSLNRLARREEKADLSDPDALHALRIRTKKLRYSAEFFAGLYDARRVKRSIAALNEIQEISGAINDLKVAERLLDGLAAGGAVSRKLVRQIEVEMAADLHVQIKALNKHVTSFYRQSLFWAGD